MNQLKLNRDGKMNLIKTISTAIVLLTALVGASLAQAETLKCKLYLNDGTAKTDTVTPPHAGVALNTMRSGGVCVFTDGRVAEKQFVMISQAIGDGSTGTVRGYSVYAFNNGDSLMLQFDGGWGAKGFFGEYKLLSGTGAYANATGGGKFVSAAGGSKTSTVYDVTFNVQ